MQIKFHYLPLVASLAICGCGEDTSQTQEARDPYDTKYARIKDPEYVKTMNERIDERKALMTEAAKVARELAAEKEKDPESPRVKELEAEQQKISLKILAQRQGTQEIVRQRIQRENDAIAAREAREGTAEKGNDLKKGNN